VAGSRVEYRFSAAPGGNPRRGFRESDGRLPDPFPGAAELGQLHEQPRAHVALRYRAGRVSGRDRRANRALWPWAARALGPCRQGIGPRRQLPSHRAGIGRAGTGSYHSLFFPGPSDAVCGRAGNGERAGLHQHLPAASHRLVGRRRGAHAQREPAKPGDRARCDDRPLPRGAVHRSPRPRPDLLPAGASYRIP
jgi:hypothetical protein